jgi:hypothetical protein
MSMKQNEFKPIRDLFRAIYFVHEPSGVLLFIRSFDYEMPDPDLVSGFITAINSFASSISKTLSRDAIRSINMDDMRIIYLRIGDLLSVAVSKNINQNEEQAMLNYLAHEFHSTYKIYIENFSGNIKIFESFEQKLILFEDFISNYRFREFSNMMQALKSTELTPLPVKQPRLIKTDLLNPQINFKY